MMEDREIVNEILGRGRTRCYEEIVRRYSGIVFSKALGICRGSDMAKEITQQTFIKAYTRLSDWRGDGSLAPWLTVIAMHLAVSALEKERRRRTSPIDQELPDTPYSDDHEQQLVQMEQAISTLPEADRQIIRLHYYERCSTEEVARRTGLTQANVLVKLHRIRERIKKQMEGEAI